MATTAREVEAQPPPQAAPQAAPSAAPSAAPDPASDPDCFGLLFVHGMGEHERGDTLKQFAEPIYTWIDAWLAANQLEKRGTLERLSDSSLRLPHAHEVTAPAHALVAITEPRPGPEPARRVRVLAAEAWWAREITSPSFGQVVGWGLGLAPWMIVRNFRGGLKGSGVTGSRSLVPLQQLLSLVVVVLFQILLLTLTVIGIIPMLRPYIATVQQKLTGSLGDPQIMVSSPLQFNAMTERVRQELGWLRTQGCSRIAVIAHSQGTGVAHAALQRDSTRVGLFVTFGTAIEKLHVARQVQRSERRLATGALLTTLGVTSLLIGGATLFKTWPLGGYDLGNTGLSVVGSPGDPYLLGRWLLGGGVALLLARQALWLEWHKQSRHGWGLGCTVAGGIAIIIGFGLVYVTGGSAVVLGWSEWLHRFRATNTWLPGGFADTDKDWVAGVIFAAAIVMAVLRELHRLSRPERDQMEQAQLKAFPRWRDWRSWAIWWEWLRGTWVGNIATSGLLLLGWLLLALAQLSRSDADDAVFFFVLTGLTLCFAAVSVPIADASEIDADQLAIPRRDEDGSLTWQDYWAAADPVPDDALTTPSGDVLFRSTSVQNRDSIIGDHSIYPENQEQFVGGIVQHIARMAGLSLDGVTTPNDAAGPWRFVERAAERRPWRVVALSRGWLVGLLGVPLAWLVLGRIGLTYLGIPVRDLLNAVAAFLPQVGSESLDAWLPLPLLGGVLVATIGVVWHRIVVAPDWRYWDHTEADFMFRREPDPKGPRSIRFERRLAGWLYCAAAWIAAASAIFAPWMVMRLQDPLNVLPAAGEGSAAPTEMPKHVWETIGPGWHGIVLAVLVALELLVAIVWLPRAIRRALNLSDAPATEVQAARAEGRAT